MVNTRTRPEAPNPEAAQKWIERAEKARDLRAGISEALGPDEDQEFQFYEWSPGRTYVKLWSMEDGSEIELPKYMAEGALYLVGPTGNYRFTAIEGQAPKPRVRDVKCFLHPESPERPLLDELGIGGYCPAKTLANETAKWAHARSRHGQQLTQYREEMDRRERQRDREEQRQYMAAIQGLVTDSPKRTTKKEADDA